MSNKKGRIIYFSHGGGPLPLLKEPSHTAMIRFMSNLANKIARPDHILVISAHWEEDPPGIIKSSSPELFYDYYGFPEETYNIQYKTPDNSEIVDETLRVLKKAGVNNIQVNSERGLDHGVFIPLKIMYPDPETPVTQLSLIQGLDPGAHLDLGEALEPLTDQNILIIGSGFSFHNLNRFNMNGEGKYSDEKNDLFQDWLSDIATGDYNAQQRRNKLENWEEAPHARYCHPREEHLLPFHVCMGTAGYSKAEVIFDDNILGKRSIAVLWEVN